jgi:hypothetical protein
LGVTIGLAANTATFTVAGLTAADNAGNGIGTVNINVLGTVQAVPYVDVITTLTDNGMTALNVSGAIGLTIGTTVDTGTSLTVTNNDTGVLTLTTVTAANATAETFTVGTGAGGMTVSTSAAVTTALSLNGAVTFTATGDGAVATVSAATDNAVINFTSTLVTAGTQSITVGNGADNITFAGAAGNVAIDNVTLGTAHSGQVNTLSYGLTGTNYATVPGGTVTNALTTDKVVFSADGAAITAVVHGTDSTTAATAITNAIAASATAAHDVGYTYDSANNTTYIAENITTTSATTSTTVIAVIGSHVPTATGAAGTILIG